jgi:hypothetical protein
VRLLFVNWAFAHHGSAQDIHNYSAVAGGLGHEVALYGAPNGRSPFNYSLDVGSADAVVFIFEFTTYLENLDFVRLLAMVPRERRVVIDCDGKYNDVISADRDANHPHADASRRWVEVCDALSDKICQPGLHPRRPNVRSFLFHAYNPAWERPLDFRAKRYGMGYVGNNWFRWRSLRRVLEALEPVRQEVGRIGLVGDGWTSLPDRRDLEFPEEAHHHDPAYLEERGVEVMSAVNFTAVVEAMGRAVFNPVIYRPLFDHLGLVSCRTFETPAAATVPLFAQEPELVEEIYGEHGLELLLPEERLAEKVLHLVECPERYAHAVEGVRRHLAEHHSYRVRLRQLIDIVEG